MTVLLNLLALIQSTSQSCRPNYPLMSQASLIDLELVTTLQ